MTSNDEDIHVIEAIGRSRIIIKNGNVAEVSVSKLRQCPLAKKFARPVEDITQDAVKANIEHRMDSWGMCQPHRKVLGTVDFVGFGASELISSGILTGSMDAAVLACDGAGTVIVTTPEMVQGIGGRMSGLVSTSPLTEEMDRIEENGGIVLDRVRATIDPVLGVARAYERGFTRVAVTVASAGTAQAIREQFPDAFIFGVHMSGITEADAERIVGVADIVTACASKWIWQVAGARALLQAGTAVPVFALTQQGKQLILDKIARSDRPVLVSGSKLPVYGPELPDPLL
ncbi:methanogenesis marker 8 protein [Methanoregula sp.]|uniref:methanogenesis marker 8 protein n=1 Tax=Methanoregula sp. TaxID=2052170 RepID=UPI002CE93AA5|nr:methanogenesis marker 8 protein [Methanoregula sp.]HVP97125.1 methanogenesis marker 8 protein [Methanoregula sp.]